MDCHRPVDYLSLTSLLTVPPNKILLYRSHPSSQQAAAPVQIPNNLLLLPLYAMSLQKSPVIRGGNDTRIDERAYFQQLLLNMDIEEVRACAVCCICVCCLLFEAFVWGTLFLCC